MHSVAAAQSEPVETASACLLNIFAALQMSRTVAPETSKGPAIIAFMRRYLWTKVAILTNTEVMLFESSLGLAKQLQSAGIEVLKPAAWERGNRQEVATILREVKRSGIQPLARAALHLMIQTGLSE